MSRLPVASAPSPIIIGGAHALMYPDAAGDGGRVRQGQGRPSCTSTPTPTRRRSDLGISGHPRKSGAEARRGARCMVPGENIIQVGPAGTERRPIISGVEWNREQRAPLSHDGRGRAVAVGLPWWRTFIAEAKEAAPSISSSRSTLTSIDPGIHPRHGDAGARWPLRCGRRSR